MPTLLFKASMERVLESIFKALATAGRVQVEAEAAERFRAPAEVRVRFPEVVVERANAPESTVSVKPPVEGPVIVRAVVPEKVRLPPDVKSPVPVVIAWLLVVLIFKVPETLSMVEALPAKERLPPEVICR